MSVCFCNMCGGLTAHQTAMPTIWPPERGVKDAQSAKTRCVYCSKLIVDLKKHEAKRHPGMTPMDRLSIAAWRLERSGGR